MTFWQTIATIYGCGALFMLMALCFTRKGDREGLLLNLAVLVFWPIALALLIARD